MAGADRERQWPARGRKCGKKESERMCMSLCGAGGVGPEDKRCGCSSRARLSFLRMIRHVFLRTDSIVTPLTYQKQREGRAEQDNVGIRAMKTELSSPDEMGHT